LTKGDGVVSLPAGVALKPSRFTLMAWEPTEPRALLLYNSFTGGFARFTAPAAELLAAAMAAPVIPDEAMDFADALVSAGLVVDQRIDELALATRLQDVYRNRHDWLNLILMPTEKCIFRCVYCYEDFVKGAMSDEVRQGILHLVAREAPRLRGLKVDWFGGEPLSAFDVVKDLSTQLIALCERNGIEYGASMTTNAYLLDEIRAPQALALGIRRFQVTIDGPKQTHDQLRVLQNGRGTFDRIIENLKLLQGLGEDFRVRIRVNFTPQVAAAVPEFLRFLGERFGGDPRFSVWFHPVGRWGGPHDGELDVCDERTSERLGLDFMQLAADAGFSLAAWRDAIQPFGSVCYAADPRSFVIGSDGNVYKCTVALAKPENLVGKLTSDGDLHLSEERFAMWTASGEETDAGCQACSFRPACHGNSCPAERMSRGGEHACPPVKRNITRVLPLLATRPQF
jgi:uncharacterized protein